jgi:hypothetical protein
MFAPLTLIGRGLRRNAGWAAARWQATPRDRRGPAALLAVAAVVGVALLPHGPILAVAALLGSAAWSGRQSRPAEPVPDPAEVKLPALYAALTPYLADPDDLCPLYRPDGAYQDAFDCWSFDADGRLSTLAIGYPAYFTDTEAAARSRIEQVVQGKAGRAFEYRFDWDLECNTLRVNALAPLPLEVPAQAWVTGPGEIMLGFTDPHATHRRIPVSHDGEPGQRPPVIWRTGPRSADPHLLVLGAPRSGTSTLLRTVALQALAHGDLLVIDGAGTGEHACLVGRPGVHTVETSLHGAVAALERAARETERRLAALSAARHRGEPVPAEVLRPLWLLLDHPTELSELARAEGRPDPQDLLEVPLRHGRAARVTVVVAEAADAAARLSPTLRAATRARVVLGDQPAAELAAALGVPLDTAPATQTPTGRGYARVGGRAPVRLQVPATVDPLDDEAPARLRDAVIALLPYRGARTEAAAPPMPAPVDLRKTVRPAPLW